MKTKVFALGAALGAFTVSLTGCGAGSSDTPPALTTTVAPSPAPGPPAPSPDTPPGPVPCPKNLTRGHCTKCWYTGGAHGDTQCKDCASPYKLQDDQSCSLSCSSLPAPATKPTMPPNAMSYNGMVWPSVCFDDAEAHFFAVGDWGGVCSFSDNKCTPTSNPYGNPGMPYPMDNRKGQPLQEPVDHQAQTMVADRMREQAQKLKAAGQAPKFVINVGDNFYPGGVDSHCGNGHQEAVFGSTQFSQIFETVYPVQDLGNIEWWSVLGNHDYGGVCYIKGWDQQVFYTWKPEGRWLMPAQYWKRTVQFKTFNVDFFFLDTNILDTESPEDDPGHNLCSSVSNPGKFCEATKYAPVPGLDASSCGDTGPTSPEDCVTWFRNVWKAQHTWLLQGLRASTADWLIVVSHHPPSFSPGKSGDGSFLVWSEVAAETGIDLIISGHKHVQKVYYNTTGGGTFLGETAWVITGGGGGITSELEPTSAGHDDAYGFMDMSISLDSIEIVAISHGGVDGKYIERSRTKVYPRGRSSAVSKTFKVSKGSETELEII